MNHELSDRNRTLGWAGTVMKFPERSGGTDTLKILTRVHFQCRVQKRRSRRTIVRKSRENSLLQSNHRLKSRCFVQSRHTIRSEDVDSGTFLRWDLSLNIKFHWYQADYLRKSYFLHSTLLQDTFIQQTPDAERVLSAYLSADAAFPGSLAIALPLRMYGVLAEESSSDPKH